MKSAEQTAELCSWLAVCVYVYVQERFVEFVVGMQRAHVGRELLWLHKEQQDLDKCSKHNARTQPARKLSTRALDIPNVECS